MTEEIQLLASDVLGRVKAPLAKREAILDEFERSGMTAMAFAGHIGVKYPTFATWVQKRKKARGRKRHAGRPTIGLVSDCCWKS